jgi:hypothetical protein
MSVPEGRSRKVSRHGPANGPREADVHSAKSRADRRPKRDVELVSQSEVAKVRVSAGSPHVGRPLPEGAPTGFR